MAKLASSVKQVFISDSRYERDMSDDARIVCVRHNLDPAVEQWHANDYSRESSLERLAASSLFIGIYRATNNGSEPARLEPELEAHLNAACERLEVDSVICLTQDGLEEESPQTERLLRRLSGRFRRYAFAGTSDLALIIDEAVKRWISTQPKKARGHLVSIQVEAADRYGILATISEKILAFSGNILKAEHRNHLHRTSVRIIAEWDAPRSESDGVTLEKAIQSGLGNILGDDFRLSVNLIFDREGTVSNRTIFNILFWDQKGVAEKLFSTLAAEQVSILESNLSTLQTTPTLGKLELVVNSGGVLDPALSQYETKLREQPNVILVERSTQRGQWWY